MQSRLKAEVVTIGTELVLGQLIDTNAAYIANALSEIGVDLAYHTTVGDDRTRMKETLRAALDRCQIVITTGGIGPTEDDLTREVAAEVFGTGLILREDLWEDIQAMFRQAGFKMAPNNKRQAYIPEGAEVIPNPRGTAPAFLYEKADSILFCLPGVPRETEPMIREIVLPRIARKYDLKGQVIMNRVLKVYGLGESNVDAAIKEVIVSSANPTIGLQASAFETKVRLTARADSREEALALLDRGEARIREKVGDFIFGRDEETLAGNVAALLKAKNWTLAVIDALTKGVTGHELGQTVDVDLFKGGLVLASKLDRDYQPPLPDLRDRVREEMKADVILEVEGFWEEEGRIRVKVRVSGPDGDTGYSQMLGSTWRLILSRGSTMALFTLYKYLRGDE